MNLRRKTLFLIVITFLCSFAFLYALSTFIIDDGFIKVEQRDVEINVNRAMDAVSDDVNNLKTVNRDWAWWDDTYEFIEDLNPEYINSSLGDESMAGLRLNLIIYLNSRGETVFAKGFDIQNNIEVPISDSAKKLVKNDSLLLNHSDPKDCQSGIVLFPEGIFLISSYAILNSDGEGPARGTLIFGRFLDDEELLRLASITHMSLTIHRLDNEQIPDDFKDVLLSFSSDKQIIVRPLDEMRVAGYTLINEINDSPSLILRVDLPREIYNQGKVSVNYLLISLISIGLIFGSISLFLIEKHVLSRILRLNNDVTQIKKSKDPSVIVAVDGEDEISYLSVSINEMLETLKGYRDHLEEMVEVRTLQLNKSLHEKEVLLREIHHRVKNNMQVVSSLLRLQTQNLDDQKYINIFNDSNNRIYSIALVHEKLYQSKDFENIDLKDYIFELASNLLDSYGRTNDVKLEIDVEDVTLDINNSVPCGLIINELLMNSLKYAFPGGRPGTIKISFRKKEDNMFQLTVSDDGIGIPKNLDIRNTRSLGLNLVIQLAESQLNGQIKLMRDGGTEFQINFRGIK
ncbi:MAG: ATP-binding protein [Candidatus Methanoperedens sp.]|nr:ATP-binding protein [Candidatus Methanoperedens sp.]